MCLYRVDKYRLCPEAAEPAFQSKSSFTTNSKCQKLQKEGPSLWKHEAGRQDCFLIAMLGPVGTPRQGWEQGMVSNRMPAIALRLRDEGCVPSRRAGASSPGASGLPSFHDAFLFLTALWLDAVNLSPRQDSIG